MPSVTARRSRREALVHALPGVAMLALSLVGGLAVNDGRSEDRGEPIYLYFGYALLGSWFALLVVSALLTRADWRTPASLGVTLLAAFLGFLNLSVRID